MGILDKLRRDLIFIKGAVRTLRRIKPFTAEAEITLADHIERWVKETPKAPAIFYEEQSLTFSELDQAANRYAQWALSQGVKRGDVVGLLMENRPEYIVAWFGMGKIGAVTALLNSNLRSHALAHCLDISGASHIIVGAECVDNFNSAKPYVEKPHSGWVTGGEVEGFQDLDAQLAECDPSPLPDNIRSGLVGEDTCFYIYTSGTTGHPKAARLSHLRVANMMHGFSAASKATSKDRMYIALPLYHSAGGVCAVGTTLTVGGAIIIARKFSTRSFWDDCIKHKATMFQYIGELCRYLLNAPQTPKETKHKIRICVGNGLRPEIWEAFKERFKLPQILEFYGATEGNVALFNYDGKPGSVGRVPNFLNAIYHYTVVKFDVENQAPLRGKNGLCIAADVNEAGEVLGEIRDTARGRFEGYSRQSETEKKILRDVFKKGDAWFRSGDLMRRDAEGYFYFVDRIGDTFRWKGENVATSEVAEVISVFEGVDEANVYGVAVPQTEGRAGMASIVINSDIDLSSFHTYITAELPDYAVPVFLRLQREISVTGTFKHRKVDLVKEGFDPSQINDPLYFHHPNENAYVPLDHEMYQRICAGEFRF